MLGPIVPLRLDKGGCLAWQFPRRPQPIRVRGCGQRGIGWVRFLDVRRSDRFVFKKNFWIFIERRTGLGTVNCVTFGGVVRSLVGLRLFGGGGLLRRRGFLELVVGEGVMEGLAVALAAGLLDPEPACFLISRTNIP